MPTFLKLEPTRRQAAIAGRVRDIQTGQTLAGIQVAITAAPAQFTAWLELKAMQYGDGWMAMSERSDRTRTAADGHFHFLDLPAGQYTLTASWPSGGSRYGIAQTVASVSRDTTGSITNRSITDLALPLTTLKGQVTGADTKEAVFLAEVLIQGSGERAFSDAQGNYLLAGLEAGTRAVQISARGYKVNIRQVQFTQAGEQQNLNVALEK